MLSFNNFPGRKYAHYAFCSLTMVVQLACQPFCQDFIKIVKWKDINYWAMKETSSRSHYTLLKLMKKYQASNFLAYTYFLHCLVPCTNVGIT